MKTVLKLLTLLLVVCACNNERNFYDPELAEQILRTRYEQNFLKQFGEVPLNYSWDVSSKSSTWKATTRSLGMVESSDYMVIEDETLNYLNKELKETQNNKSKGRTFIMVVPNNGFTIVPIYQGLAGSKYDLYMEVDGTVEKVWSKGTGIQTQDEVYVRNDPSEQWVKSSTQPTWKSIDAGSRMDDHTPVFYDSEGNKVDEAAAVKKAVPMKNVRAKKYTFDLPELRGKTMSFYIKITEGASGHSSTGDIQSSVGGYMVDLENCPTPSTLEEGTQVTVIGCETANEKEVNGKANKCDWDMNDAVFMLYGKPYAPTVVEIKDDMVDNVIEKRYMFEDLGTTDDFDFNDVVVDLRDIETIQLHYENGIKISESVVDHQQEMVIRHLGGTLPFTIKLGGKVIYSGGGPGTFMTSPNTGMSLEEFLWNPDLNNISIVVNGDASTELKSYELEFPEDGCRSPVVIATDVTVPWNAERASITKQWFESLR